MTEKFTRFAIRSATGEFSRPAGHGPSWVTLDKAKLWRTKGHVTQHLQGCKYPPGAVVVEVSYTPSVEPLMVVSEYRTAYEKRITERDAKRAEEHAKRQLAEAEARYLALKGKADVRASDGRGLVDRRRDAL